jgi:hypothetical protein
MPTLSKINPSNKNHFYQKITRYHLIRWAVIFLLNSSFTILWLIDGCSNKVGLGEVYGGGQECETFLQTHFKINTFSSAGSIFDELIFFFVVNKLLFWILKKKFPLIHLVQQKYTDLFIIFASISVVFYVDRY